MKAIFKCLFAQASNLLTYCKPNQTEAKKTNTGNKEWTDGFWVNVAEERTWGKMKAGGCTVTSSAHIYKDHTVENTARILVRSGCGRMPVPLFKK